MYGISKCSFLCDYWLIFLAPLHSDNCIYALGGFDSSNYQSSVERLDPRMGKWMSVPSMSNRRSSAGVASLDGFLFCIGGNDGTMCLQTGEKFNPRRNVWEPIATMHSRRWKFITECSLLFSGLNQHPHGFCEFQFPIFEI